MNDFETRFKMISSLASNHEIDISLSYNKKWCIKTESKEDCEYQSYYSFEQCHPNKDICLNKFIIKFKKSLMDFKKYNVGLVEKEVIDISESEESIRGLKVFIQDIEATIGALGNV